MSSRGGTTLYVTGFGPNTRARDLAYEFERYGRLVRCDIPAPRNASSRLFAFVEYESRRDSDDAYHEMHNFRFSRDESLKIEWARTPPSANWRFESRSGPPPRRERSPRRRSMSPRRGRGELSPRKDDRRERDYDRRDRDYDRRDRDREREPSRTPDDRDRDAKDVRGRDDERAGDGDRADERAGDRDADRDGDRDGDREMDAPNGDAHKETVEEHPQAQHDELDTAE